MASPERIEAFVEKQADFAQKNQVEIDRRVAEQRAREVQIIEQTQSFCPVDKLQDRTLRAEDIERALKEGYGDANVLRSLLCLNNATLSMPQLNQTRGVSQNFKVRQYIRKLKQIGGESAEGYAMLADVKGRQKDGSNLFVVKSPRRIDPELRLNQIHEYFIGAFGTNKLRDRIPNFSFVLGFFQCSPPYIDEKAYLAGPGATRGGATRGGTKDRQSLTYCQNDSPENEVNYLLYENVANAKTLHDFILEGATFEDYLNILVQVTLALDLAYQEFDFTHYDLHHENVLVRTLDQEIYIPYVVRADGTQAYLKTRHVATIIDFGRCHIKYDGQHYGYSLVEYGLFPDRSYPMYDLYKILMFSLSTALFGDRDNQGYAGLTDAQLSDRKMIHNEDIFNRGKELITYFDPDLPRDRLNQELITAGDYTSETLEFYYTLPYTKEFNIRPLDFFEHALQPAYSELVQKFMSDQEPVDINLVYGCANRGVCQTLQHALSEYSVDDEALIRDPYMFYESVVEGETTQTDLVEVLRRGRPHFEDYLTQLLADKESYFSEYQTLAKGLTIVALRTSRQFDRTFLESYRSFIAKSVKMVDLMTSIAMIETIIRKIVQVYPDLASQPVSTSPGLTQGYSYQDLPDRIFQPIRDQTRNLDQIISSIKMDVGYINQLDKKATLAQYPDALWLFQKMPTLTAAINQL